MAKQIDIKIALLKSSEVKLDQAINYTALMLRKSIKSVLAMTARFYVQSASKLTKRSKGEKGGKRDWRKLHKKSPARRYGFKFQVLKFSEKKPRGYWIFAKDVTEREQLRKIKYKGLYQKIWFEMMPGLGKTNNKSYGDQKTGAYAKRSVKVINKSWLNDEPSILLSHRQKEILDKIAPGVGPHALNLAKKRLIGYMRKEVRKKLERAWANKK